jgi:hypothetical protein
MKRSTTPSSRNGLTGSSACPASLKSWYAPIVRPAVVDLARPLFSP